MNTLIIQILLLVYFVSAGWDFAIRQPKYAKLNHSTLKTQLQLLLGMCHKLSLNKIAIMIPIVTPLLHFGKTGYEGARN